MTFTKRVRLLSNSATLLRGTPTAGLLAGWFLLPLGYSAASHKGCPTAASFVLDAEQFPVRWTDFLKDCHISHQPLFCWACNLHYHNAPWLKMVGADRTMNTKVMKGRKFVGFFLWALTSTTHQTDVCLLSAFWIFWCIWYRAALFCTSAWD